MSYMRGALSFAEGLVDYVLERYCSGDKYKPSSPNYLFRRKPNTSGILAGIGGGQEKSRFRAICGAAVVALQPRFENEIDQIESVVHDRVPERFEAVKFLEFCSLVTLEMARDYFYKANLSIADETAVCIAQLLKTFYWQGSFTDASSWDNLYKTSLSILKFEKDVSRGVEVWGTEPTPPFEQQQQDNVPSFEQQQQGECVPSFEQQQQGECVQSFEQQQQDAYVSLFEPQQQQGAYVPSFELQQEGVYVPSFELQQQQGVYVPSFEQPQGVYVPSFEQQQQGVYAPQQSFYNSCYPTGLLYYQPVSEKIF